MYIVAPQIYPSRSYPSGKEGRQKFLSLQILKGPIYEKVYKEIISHKTTF